MNVQYITPCTAMYGQDFQPSEALKAMVCFKGGDLHSLSRSEQEVLIKAASEVRDLPPVSLVSCALNR